MRSILPQLFLFLILCSSGCSDRSDSSPASADEPWYTIDLAVNNDGWDAGGGSWSLEVSALVHHEDNSPVDNGLAVCFSVSSDEISITGGETGDRGRSDIVTAGVAHAVLTYNSSNTFDTVIITAHVPDLWLDVADSIQHVLPLIRGKLKLHIDPANYMFGQDQDTARIRCWASLKDGHEAPINNAPVLFTSTNGRFTWFDYLQGMYVEFQPDPARKFTGWSSPENAEHNEAPGQATVFLIAVENDIFLDPYTLEWNVQICAEVEDYIDVVADPRIVKFTR